MVDYFQRSVKPLAKCEQHPAQRKNNLHLTSAVQRLHICSGQGGEMQVDSKKSDLIKHLKFDL